MSDSKWPYPVGKFVCHQCGNCCRGDGFVELEEGEPERIAAYLGLELEEFREMYCQDRQDGEFFLIDQGDEEQSCVFLTEDDRCRIQDVKPDQCRGFPTKWRPKNALEFCAGLRASAGLPPPERKTMSPKKGEW